MIKKTISIDMDGVLADIKQSYLSYYFEETGICIDENDIIGQREADCVPDKTAISRYLHTPGFFRSIPVAKDAQDVVKELQNYYDIYVVSAAMEFPTSLFEKREWLQEHFPFISWKNIVFCGYKGVINTDFLIDDHIKNLDSFLGRGLLFETFHNVTEDRFERLKNWNDVHRFFITDLSNKVMNL
ncbi:MAG: 5'(3')-deoxyribonucleotidase [Sphingobacterium sp.]|jgi:5'(3')-deoxyribonucleotidase|nr:5'(3')-deoxyribonucleotidase [Sphingobacterium sp.]